MVFSDARARSATARPQDAAASMSSREAPQARCHPARLLSSIFCQACLPLGPGTAADVLMTEGRRPWKGRGLWGHLAWQVNVKETVRSMAVSPRALIQKAIHRHLGHLCRARACFAMLFAMSDVWVHVYHCDPYTGFLNRRALHGIANLVLLRVAVAVCSKTLTCRMLLKNSEIGGACSTSGENSSLGFCAE